MPKKWASRVRLENSFSSFSDVHSGVPQGSVLGPLLFLIYINDLPSVVMHSKLKLFADDCKLYFCTKTHHERDALQSDLSQVQDWCERHQLSLALSKCSILHLGPRTNIHHEYSLGGKALPSTQCIRYLGVIVSTDLRFTEHCNNIAHSAGQKTRVILNSFVNRNPKFLMQMYKTFVRSRLEYASQVWNPSLKQDIVSLESVQFRGNSPSIYQTWEL